jgi:aspartate racemase
MRTIGMLGGIGPQATMDFEARIHRISQCLLSQDFNTGYPPLVTVFLRHPPILVENGRPTEPLTLDPRLLQTAAKLGQWVDLLVIPCNTPHFFLDEIRAAAGCEMIGIIDVTVEHLKRRGETPVGLIGLGIPKIYASRFEAEGLDFETAPASVRERLDDAILHVMEGRETHEDRQVARDAVAEVRAAGAPVTVLGCTEIPLLLGEDAEAPDLVNPAQLLAEAAVRRAIE